MNEVASDSKYDLPTLWYMDQNNQPCSIIIYLVVQNKQPCGIIIYLAVPVATLRYLVHLAVPCGILRCLVRPMTQTSLRISIFLFAL